MAILIDTSVWVDHFRNRNDGLIQLLSRDLIHPMIPAEIACGTPQTPRLRTPGDLGLLSQSTEVMTFIENEKLYGPGCGLVALTFSWHQP